MKWLIPCAVVSMMTLQSPAETIAYWPFGESGLTDASGNGHALSGGATVTDCATFGGSAATSLQTASSLDLSGKTAVTIEFFAKVKDSAGQVNFLEHGSSYGAQLGGFQVNLNERDPGDQRVAALWYGQTSSNWYQTIGCIDSDKDPLQDGRWHHVAVVLKTASSAGYSESSLSDWCLSLYIDGVITKSYQRTALTAMTGPGLSLANATLFIGSRNGKELFLDGQLDDIRITDGALTPAEFLQKRTGSSEANVLAFWPFGSHGFADVSGNGRDLHASAGVSFATDGAAAMDGTETYFQTIRPFDLRTQENGLTIECFFKASTSAGTVQPLFTHIAAFKDQANSSLQGYLTADGRVVTKVRTSAGAENADVTSNTYNDGNWHHLAWVLDPESATDTARLYVDDECVPPASVGPENDAPIAHLETGFFAFGSAPVDTTTDHFAGEIDDVRVTGGVLSPEDFISERTAEAGAAEPLPEADPFTLAYWKFDSHNGLKDEAGLYSLTMPVDGTVGFEGGAAVFTGIGGLATLAAPDLLPYKKLTLEFFLRYPEKNVDDTSFDMNFVELSRNFDNVHGAFRLSSDVGYGDYPARAGALFRTSAGYSGDLYTQPTYGDDAWHHWVYRIDSSGKALVTELYVDGVKIAHDAIAFKSTTPTAFPLNEKLFLGIRSDTTVGEAGNWKVQKALYGMMDDVRLTAGWLPQEQWLSERSAEEPVVGRPIARWTFDGKNPLADVSGNGNDLLVGSTGVAFHDGVAVMDAGRLWTRSGAIAFASYRALTIEMVYRSTNPFGSKGMLFELGNNYTDYGSSQFYALMNSDGEVRGGFNGNDRSVAGHPVNADEWTHLALSVDLDCASASDQVKLFLNGERVSSGTAQVLLSSMRTEEFFIGGRQSDLYFFGEIDDVALTEGALVPSNFVLSRPSPIKASSTSLVYWPFRRQNPQADKSGNGFALEANAAVAFEDGCAVLSSGGLIWSSDYLPYALCTNGLTVECWVKYDSSAGAQGGRLCLFQTSATGQSGIDDDPGVLGVDMYSSALFGRWNSGNLLGNRSYPLLNTDSSLYQTDIKNGAWHHVAMIYDPKATGADRTRLYVDFVKMPTFKDRACDRDQPILGGRLQVGGGSFVGKIDDLRVTAAALEPEQFLHVRSTVPGVLILIR